MRVVIQRVKNARVEVDGETTGQIKEGMLVYAGFSQNDSETDLNWMVNKIINLRIFDDENGKMNLSLADVGLGVLVVSQFTLLGDCKKGRRPSFDNAAKASDARDMYDRFLKLLKKDVLDLQSGVFQAHMNVSYSNDGPVTMIIDSKN